MAEEMIRFDQVPLGEEALPFSFELAAGTSLVLAGVSRQTGEQVLRLCLGTSAPAAGSVRVLGLVPAEQAGEERTLFRRRLAIIPESGGFLSNLSAWENLLLPLAYHENPGELELEKRGLAALAAVGFHGDPELLPSRLTLFCHRQLAIARAILTGADLLLGQGLFDGLDSREESQLAAGIDRFMAGGSNRSVLCLTSSDSLRQLASAATINLQYGIDHAPRN